jgi:CRP/FNR family nitrogen fixation transcriptional regulator
MQSEVGFVRHTRAADPDVLDLLEQFGSSVAVAGDKEVYRKDDASDCCWRVTTGCVRRVEYLEDGRRHVNAFLLPGELFGLVDAGRRFTAEAVSRTTLRCYPRKAVEALAKSNPALSAGLGALTIKKLHHAYQHMVLLSRRTAAEKVASFLLEMDQRIGRSKNNALSLPMGRADIADYLGITKETLSRALTEMARQGSIILDRGRIELHDQFNLHELAGHRYAERRCAVRQQAQPRRSVVGALL